jgi:hypothetical protein
MAMGIILLTLRIPDEGYSRNESFTLNYTSTFLLLRTQTEFEVKDTTNTQKSPSSLDFSDKPLTTGRMIPSTTYSLPTDVTRWQ